MVGGGFEAVNGRRLGEFAPDSPLEGDGFGLTALADLPKNPKISAIFSV